MAERTGDCVYKIDTLLYLRNRLPKLLCSISKFSKDSVDEGIFRCPSTYRISQSKNEIEDSSQNGSRLPLRIKIPTREEQVRIDFGRWVGKVTSPSHNRVTAGGRVVPVIPPPPRPAFATPVASGSSAFGPPLQRTENRPIVTGNPPVGYLPVAPGYKIIHINGLPYIGPDDPSATPGAAPWPVQAAHYSHQYNGNFGLQLPLMNATNAMVPQMQPATFNLPFPYQQQVPGQQHGVTGSYLQPISGVPQQADPMTWNYDLRGAYFEEQSRQARLRRVNGHNPKLVELEPTEENARTWNGKLVSDGEAYASKAPRMMNYGSPSAKPSPESVGRLTALNSIRFNAALPGKTLGSGASLPNLTENDIFDKNKKVENLDNNASGNKVGNIVSASGDTDNKGASLSPDSSKEIDRSHGTLIGIDSNVASSGLKTEKTDPASQEGVFKGDDKSRGGITGSSSSVKDDISTSEKGKVALETISLYLKQQMGKEKLQATRVDRKGKGKVQELPVTPEKNHKKGPLCNIWDAQSKVENYGKSEIYTVDLGGTVPTPSESDLLRVWKHDGTPEARIRKLSEQTAKLSDDDIKTLSLRTGLEKDILEDTKMLASLTDGKMKDTFLKLMLQDPRYSVKSCAATFSSSKASSSGAVSSAQATGTLPQYRSAAENFKDATAPNSAAARPNTSPATSAAGFLGGRSDGNVPRWAEKMEEFSL